MGTFKELVFELRGGPSRMPHIQHVLERPTLVVRVESIQYHGGTVWEVARATGTRQEIEELSEVVRRPPVPPLAALEVISKESRSLRWLARWDRAEVGTVPVSPFQLVHDHLGPDAIVSFRIAEGKIEVRVAGRSCEDLRRLHEAFVRDYAPRFEVRLVRIGHVSGERPAVLDEDRALLARAIQAGYYDEPKRIGVRELGEDLGWSKTVISRKLRALERKAVELLAAE